MTTILYTIYLWAMTVAAVLVFGGALGLLIPFTRKGPLYHVIVGAWGRTIVRLAGISVTVTGTEKVDVSRPCVFMSNHQSYFDVICLAGFLPVSVRFVAKKGLAYVPFLGQLMWATGHIFINRARHENAVAEIKKAAAKIGAGTSILVFPEGTRSTDHRLGPFKKGGFMLALEARVPVTPVSIAGTAPIMPKGGLRSRRGPVTIVIGDPIATADMTKDDRQKLVDAARAAVIANFPEGSAEHEANPEENEPVGKV